MIGALLDRADASADAADLVAKTDETVSLQFESGRLKTTAYAQERGVNLRLLHEGRMGFAGTTSATVDELVDAALASARIGEEVDLLLPAPAPLPPVVTSVPGAAAAPVADLIDLGRGVVDRLQRDGCQVTVRLERTIGSVHVANTRGVRAAYDVSAVSLSAEITRVRGDDVLIVGDYLEHAGLPHSSEVAALVDRLLQRLDWAAQTVDSPAGLLPVLFTPGGLDAFLMPLRQACHGKAVLQGISPLAERQGQPVFDSAFSLRDAPHLPGRPGSRAVDDEGVVTRSLALVDRGRIGDWIADLETAARLGIPATGHGRRSTFGKPQAAYSNLVVDPGTHSQAELLGLIDDGLLVEDLIGVGQGNVIGGAFSHPVALAYRVRRGEVVGRVKSVAVAGNAYQLLGRVAGVGRDVHWRGSAGSPAMLFEGVAVTPR